MKATDCGGFGDSEGIETMSQLRQKTKEVDRVRTVERLERRDKSLEFTLDTMEFEILVGSEYDSFVLKSVSLVRDDGGEGRK